MSNSAWSSWPSGAHPGANPPGPHPAHRAHARITHTSQCLQFCQGRDRPAIWSSHPCLGGCVKQQRSWLVLPPDNPWYNGRCVWSTDLFRELVTKMTTSGLYVHNVDFHYHAGQERQPGTTLAGYLEHAQLTGRIVLGVTDHLERYIGSPPSAPRDPQLYEQSVEGLLSYRRDVDALRDQFPALRICFGPEIHASPRIDISSLPSQVVDVSDYFVMGLPSDQSSQVADTEAKVERTRGIARMCDATGRPAFVCHPFRSAVNRRLVKGRIEPWVTALRPRASLDFPEDMLNRFFGFDVRVVARACREHEVPIEVNGGTHGRIRSINLPAPLQMLWASYRIFRDEGVGLVPGSDQHAYFRPPDRREGRQVPFDTFEALGVTASDIGFVGQVMKGVV